MQVDENANGKDIDPYSVKVYKALPQLSPKESKSFSGRFLQKKRDNSVSVPGISSLLPPSDPKSAHREFKYNSNYDISSKGKGSVDIGNKFRQEKNSL